MIGLYLRYQRSELVQITMQLATWLRISGHEVTILGLGEVDQTAYPWDTNIKSDYQVPFTRLLESCTHVVMIGTVHPMHVFMARRTNTKLIYVTSWDDKAYLQRLYKLVHRVVCLSPSLASKLRSELNLTNLVYVPIDIPTLQPHNSPILRPDKPRVLLNLHGPRSNRIGAKLLLTLRRWFHQIPAEWTVLAPKAMLQPKSWLSRAYTSPHKDSSFTTVSDYSWDSQRQLYGNADLTIWPELGTGYAMPAVLSLLMGSPVVTFDVPPANEYLSRGSNGVLVLCTTQFTTNGTAVAQPDLPKLEASVTQLLTNPEKLARMKSKVGDWTTERRKLFYDGWTKVFA